MKQRLLCFGAALVGILGLSRPAQGVGGLPAITSWLECEDCADEQKLLSRFGPTEVNILTEIVVSGTPAILKERHDQHLKGAYAAMEAYNEKYEGGRPLALSLGEYLAYYQGSRDSLYRLRAVEALQLLDRAHARRAIERALAQPGLPESLIATLRARMEALEP